MTQPKTVLTKVLLDVTANAALFLIATFVIIKIASWSRGMGLFLAWIEAICALLQSLIVISLITSGIGVRVMIALGKFKRQSDETELTLASLLRVAELAIWIGCLIALYRFFYGSN